MSTGLKIEVQEDGNLVQSNSDVVVGSVGSVDPGGQIYIIQTSDGGDGIPVEGAEVVVASSNGTGPSDIDRVGLAANTWAWSPA